MRLTAVPQPCGRSAHIGTAGTVTAISHVGALEKKGYLRRREGSSRGIMLTQAPSATVSLPIVGRIRAGMLQPAIEDSTTDQNIEPQIEALKSAGCDRIYQEQLSGVDAARPELLSMIDYCRDGDVIVCTKLDRIGRSTKDVLNITDKLTSKGVAFKCLNINLDTTTATGKMMLTIIAAVATFEREIML